MLENLGTLLFAFLLALGLLAPLLVQAARENRRDR